MLSIISFITVMFSLTTPAFAADPPAACTGLTGAENDRCQEERLVALELRAADGVSSSSRRPAAPAPTSIEFRWLVCGVARGEVCRREWGGDTPEYMLRIEERYGCSQFAPRIDLYAALAGDPAQCRRGQPAPPAPATDRLPSSDKLPVDREAAPSAMKFTLAAPLSLVAYANPEGDGMRAIPSAGLQIGFANLKKKAWGWSAAGGGFVGGQATAGVELSLSGLYGLEKNLFVGPRVAYNHWEEGIVDDYIVANKGDAAVVGIDLRLLPENFSIGFNAGLMPYALANGNRRTGGVGFQSGFVLGGVF